MKIPQQLVSHVLTIAEAMAHEGGWDQAPALLVIYARSMSLEAVDDPRLSDLAQGRGETGALGVLPLDIPDEMWQDMPPGEVIQVLGEAFMDPTSPLRDMVESMAVPSFVGIAFLSEAWMNASPDLDRRRTDPRRLADIPGSVEVRQIDCVDVSGRYTRVERVRGCDPEVVEERARLGWGGRVIEGLRDMVLGVAKNMRPDDADLSSIARLAPYRH